MVSFSAMTLSRAYQSLRARESFWLAMGEFVNSFFLYHVTERQQLLDEPLETSVEMSEEEQRWAAFCAGAAEYLAEKYKLCCPSWAMKPEYRLNERWCLTERGSMEQIAELTPVPFLRRGVMCSDRVFSNPRQSSKEPGNFQERRARLQEVLAEMEPDERAAYLASYNKRVPAYLRLLTSTMMNGPSSGLA